MSVTTELLGPITELVEPTTKAIMELITPYLPALKQCNTDVFNHAVGGIWSQDWSRVDEALHSYMSEAERDQLRSQSTKDARKAVKHAFETRRTFRYDLLKAVLGIAVSLA